jgi:ATPase family protein associated with various cellular activities (AAA)/winged helix domain-containing protein
MTAETDWLDRNNEYLAASLHWLRLRLRRLADPASAMDASARPPEARDEAVTTLVVAAQGTLAKRRPPDRRASRSRGAAAERRTRRTGARRTAPPAVVAGTPDRDPALDDAVARRQAAAAIDPPPGLTLVAERLGLTAFERDTLLLCAAADLDPAIEALFAAAQGGTGRAFPTFSLALRLFDDPSWDALSPHRPLRYARLLEISQPGATPLTAAALRADERIVNFIKGMNALDERVAALVTPLAAGHPDGGAPDLAPSQHSAVDELFERMRGGGDPMLSTVYLLGVDAGSKLAVARALCDRLHRRLYRLGLDTLPAARAEIEAFTRLWQRETALLPVALYVDAEQLDATSSELAAGFRALTSQDIGLVFVAQRDAPVRTAGPVGHLLEVEKPTPGEQRDAWLAALHEIEGSLDAGRDRGATASRLAGQFHLNLQDIREAMARAVERAVRQEPTGTAVADRLWDTCRSLTQPRLDALAQRLTPKATWNDLVLSDESTALLRQIAGQVRERFRVYEDWGYARRMTRGFGITALFVGESGVGKTMAAEVIADELRLHLYRIDLSAVVSKYIGETEKNLRRLFDAAEHGGAILLFDEADALFGKRSEVKDSHDHYANIEINYLLQRMEAFSGLAILATNMKSALDPAFMRRLRFIVNFQFPGLAERKQLWEKALPPDVPREGLDYDRLARFALSGGNIHSIALNAAFLAAQRATPVTQPLILSAVRSELRKLGKPIHETEFR